jgi:drug/metabolite transporter (DMT)-like permease
MVGDGIDGTAPLIVAIVSTFQMDDTLSHFAWMGVMAICAGIFIIALGGTLKDRKGIRLALLNALVIARLHFDSRDLHTVCRFNCGLCSAGAHRT